MARCREFDQPRDEVKLKLREIGLVDDCPWGVIIKGGVEFRKGREGTLERRQAALRILNGFIRKVDQRKRENLEKAKKNRPEERKEKAETGGDFRDHAGGEKARGPLRTAGYAEHSTRQHGQSEEHEHQRAGREAH